MTDTRKRRGHLPQDLEARSKPAPIDKRRMTTCPICGQTYNLNHLGEAFHHNDAPHEPLPLA